MKINNRGFAITAIIYSILVIVIIIMTLVLAIISTRRQTVEKIQERVKKQTSEVRENVDTPPVNPPITPTNKTLYEIIASLAKDDSNVAFGKYSGSISKDYPLAEINDSGVFNLKNSNIYYYRGAVNNNYVVFDNKCWKIVRTTETKGVKMIYSGTATNNKCDSYKEEDILTDTSTYGTSSTYKNSAMSTTLSTWYTTKITAAGKNSLEPFKLCNDTSKATYDRIISSKPNLTICYNGGLDVYIGLLTADEVMYAGGAITNSTNSTGVKLNYFLRIDQSAPNSYSNYKNVIYNTVSAGENNKNIIYVGSEGQMLEKKVNGSVSFTVRPVVSLKPNIEPISGTGTMEDPYVIS